MAATANVKVAEDAPVFDVRLLGHVFGVARILKGLHVSEAEGNRGAIVGQRFRLRLLSAASALFAFAHPSSGHWSRVGKHGPELRDFALAARAGSFLAWWAGCFCATETLLENTHPSSPSGVLTCM